MSRSSVYCNACSSKATITSSKVITTSVTHLYCQCKNIHCGHTFRMSQSFDHTICPPAGTQEQMILAFMQNMAPEKRKSLLAELT